MKATVFKNPKDVQCEVQRYDEWKKTALKTVIALSENYNEADGLIEKYSGISTLNYSNGINLIPLKYAYASTLFGIRKYAAFPTSEIDLIDDKDYRVLIDLIVNLKRV